MKQEDVDSCVFEVTLEEGKYYKLRSGQRVGPLWEEEEDIFRSNDLVDYFMPIWKRDGKADFFPYPEENFPEHDIVEEWRK